MQFGASVAQLWPPSWLFRPHPVNTPGREESLFPILLIEAWTTTCTFQAELFHEGPEKIQGCWQWQWVNRDWERKVLGRFENKLADRPCRGEGERGAQGIGHNTSKFSHNSPAGKVGLREHDSPKDIPQVSVAEGGQAHCHYYYYNCCDEDEDDDDDDDMILLLRSNTFQIMAISKVLLVLYLLFCKTLQSLLSHHCLARGQGSIKCLGTVWTEPAPVIQMGQNFSINCHCRKKDCQNGKLSMRLNDIDVEDTLLSVINQTTVQLNLHDYNEPFSRVSCFLKRFKGLLICGTQFCMGYLPDKPANLTCIKPEQSDNMDCAWNPGRETHLTTKYILYVKSLFTEENKAFDSNNTSVILPVNQLQKNQTFSISVHAENYLGGVRSEELHVDLNTIVTPAVPVVVQNKTVESPAFKTIVQWKRQTAVNETYCEERYKETISETWHVRDWDANLRDELYTEYNLDANTKYEFQIRCKVTHPRSLWSRWSESAVYITPEQEPAAVLDVWRKFGPTYPNATQEMTILIKPLSPKESRGRILNYRVFYENQGGQVDLCKTTETFCKVMVPPAVTTIYVTAHNSKGSSKPANIIVKQPLHNFQDFPPPTNMKIITDKQNGISITWEPPITTGKTLLWYIVEWISADFSHFHHSIAWKKVPFQNASTSIEESIRMENSSTISVYAVYQKGISQASSVQTMRRHPVQCGSGPGTGDSTPNPVERANGCPAGEEPSLNVTWVTTGESLAEWVTLDATGESLPVMVGAAWEQWHAPTASGGDRWRSGQAAGGAPENACCGATEAHLARIKWLLVELALECGGSDRGNYDYDTGILLGTGVGVAFLSISVLALITIKSCRKRVNKMVSSVTPKWLFEEYPKMQNSKVIKYLQEKNDAVTHNFSRPFLDYEDVVVTEVEEILVQKHYGVVGEQRGKSEMVSEKVDIGEDVPFASDSGVTERNGYKPQTSNKAQLGTNFSTTSEIHFQSWETKTNSLALPVSNLRKDYTSPVAPVWPIVDTNENTSLFDKINLVLRNSGSGQSRVISTDKDPGSPRTKQWTFLLSDEDSQERTLIPDSLLSCLKTVNEDSHNMMSYFPQNTVYYED
ncbi:interleukin-23 receptor [Candoia aspera]|uniref:interleukin-23 receptor n=1 Tax=Candoia aspera TaxID=51853 RepID=UPI002FD7D473